MSGQLEDSDDPKQFDDSQQSEELSNSHDLSRVAAARSVSILISGDLSGLGSNLSFRHEQLIPGNYLSEKYELSPILQVLPVEYQADVVRQHGYEVDDVHQFGHKF